MRKIIYFVGLAGDLSKINLQKMFSIMPGIQALEVSFGLVTTQEDFTSL